METTKIDATNTYIGMGMLLLGGALWYVLRPQRGDFMEFINRHNKLNNKTKLKWNVGFNNISKKNEIFAKLKHNF